MPSIVKNKGMAKAPSFYKGGASSSSSTPIKTQNLPILIGIVAVGAAIILYMRTRELSPSNVGPALTVVPTTDADQSQIANMIQALKAIGQIHPPSSQPSGGATTPVTPSPSQSNSGNIYTPEQAAMLGAAYDAQVKADFTEINAYKMGLIQQFGPDAPYSGIDKLVRARFGGAPPQGGPETVLTAGQYQTYVLGQYAGQNPNLLVDPRATYNRQAWLDHLLKIGPAGYVGVNSGVRDDNEYYRNLEIARYNASGGGTG